MEAGVPLNSLLPEGFRERREESDNGSSQNEHPDVPAALQPDDDVPLTHARLGRMIAMIGSFALAVDRSSHLRGNAPPVDPSPAPTAPAPVPQFKKSLTLQYDAFRSGMEKEEAKAFYARLVVVWVLFILFWAVSISLSVSLFVLTTWIAARLGYIYADGRVEYRTFALFLYVASSFPWLYRD